MRQIGAAQRCLELMCQRGSSREAFGKLLTDQGMVRKDIALSRCEIEQARYLTLAAASEMDRVGNKAAKDLISMITIVGPQMAQTVADRAIQVHGGIGVSSDTPIADIFATARFLRLADGPNTARLAPRTPCVHCS